MRRSRLPIRVTYNQSPSIKNILVRSALLPKGCTVHNKYIEQQQREKKRPGKPRDDCISCQAGLERALCDQRFCVYSLTCKLCQDEYVGESQRAIRKRMLEHQADARKRKKESPWGEHFLEKHNEETVGKVPIFAVKVLAVEESIIRRRAREAIEIRERQPAINRSKGWKLD